MDFSGGLEIYTMISDQLSDLDIGVLGELKGGHKDRTSHYIAMIDVVNNIRFSLEYKDVLDKLPDEVS